MSDFEDRLGQALGGGADDAPAPHDLADGARRRLRARRRSYAVAGIAGAALAIAVPAVLVTGGGAAPDSGGKDPAAPADTTGSGEDVLVTCGGSASWPVSAMADGVAHDLDDAEVRAELARLADEMGIDAPRAVQEQGAEDAPYVVLSVTDAVVTLGVGTWTLDGPGDDGQYVSMERADAGLRADGWGDCHHLAVAVPDGRSRVVVLAPAGGVDPGSATPEVLVNEVECTSGRDPRPFLGDPQVVVTDDRVLVTLTTESVAGAADCQGVAPVPITLELDEPLGDRALYDAGTWPPTPITVADTRAVVVDGATVGAVPADWREHTCTFEDGSGGTFEVYGPTAEDACSYRAALAFYGAATFDPVSSEGEIRTSTEGETWGGFVYSADGETAVWVVAPERALTRRILDSVE